MQELTESQFNRSVAAVRSTWERLAAAEAREKDTADLRARLEKAEQRAGAAEAQRAEAARREEGLRDRLSGAERALAQVRGTLSRTHAQLEAETSRADLEHSKFANIARKLGIPVAPSSAAAGSMGEAAAAAAAAVAAVGAGAPADVTPGAGQQQRGGQRACGLKRRRDPPEDGGASSVLQPRGASSSDQQQRPAPTQQVQQKQRASYSDAAADARPHSVARLGGARQQPGSGIRSLPATHASPSSARPAAGRSARPRQSSEAYPGAAVDALNAVGQSAPSNMRRLIDAQLLPRGTRVFQGKGAQLARDQHARAAGHRCVLAYGLPNGGGNCYLSFPDQLSFVKVYHKMLLRVADPSVDLQPHVRLDDVCFYEQLYLPCSWYFDVEEEQAGKPLPDLAKTVTSAIRDAARLQGIDDLGVCSVTDGSRAPRDKRGYKNSLHLVFRESPVCAHPTSNSADPDYPPLRAVQEVHSKLDVQDGKGAKQPDIGVYTSRRNMRLVGSCKVGQPVPLVPGEAFPNKGFSLTSWMEWLKSAAPEDLLQFMISRDDGTVEPNWQTELASGGPRRVNGDVDNWDALGPAVGGVMSQTVAGHSPVVKTRMPALKPWANKRDDDEIDDGADQQDRDAKRQRGSGGGGSGDSRHSSSSSRHSSSRGRVRDDRGRRRDIDRDNGGRSGGGGSGSRRAGRSRGGRSPSPNFDDDGSQGGNDDVGFDSSSRAGGGGGSTHRSSSSSSSRGGGGGTSSRNARGGGNRGGGGDRSARSSGGGSSRLSSSSGRPAPAAGGHRSMTRQAFDAQSPHRSRQSARPGSFGGTAQQLLVTTVDAAAQRIMRHQNHNGVVRNQSVRAEMQGYECFECKAFADAMDMSASQRKEQCQNCSKHRAAEPAGRWDSVGGFGAPPAGPPPTPQGYWDTSFPESQTQGVD